MAVPVKYREIGDFHEYYSGARVAPYLTIFIGGNHEASNHLWELYYGGWVAPNIYYLGAANVVKLGSIRIAGQSGIWKGYNYKKSHHERLPYSQDDVRSIYHVRELDTRKLLQIRSQINVGLSHDWPRGVEWLGDWRDLFRKKDQFEADARAGNLGSVAAKLVLERLRPPYWFSAHLHIKYPAIVDHSKGNLPHREPPTGRNTVGLNPQNAAKMKDVPEFRNEAEIDLDLEDLEPTGLAPNSEPSVVRNEDEIDLGDDDELEAQAPKVTNVEHNISQSTAPVTHSVSAVIREQLPASFFAKPKPEPRVETPHNIKNSVTHFLALDKCLPRREFLQVLEIPPSDTELRKIDCTPLRLSYDPEWLAITRVFANDLQLGDAVAQVPDDKGRAHYLPLIESEEQWVTENIVAKGLLTIPENFSPTALFHNPGDPVITPSLPREYNNPQTAAFCALLDITNPFAASEEEMVARHNMGPPPSTNGDSSRGRGRGGHRGRGDRGSGRGGGGRGGRGGGRSGGWGWR